MALAHHDASHRDQWSGREAKLFGAQQGGDGDVAASLKLAVGLHPDAAAQIVQDQYLLSLRQAEFPGNAGMLNGTQRGRAGAAAIAADQYDIGVCLGHSRCDGSHADFRDKFYRDAGLRINILEVIDQLREIFDGIDIVMRRRRDEAHAWNGMADAGNNAVDLVSWKLAALAWFGALRHFNLQLVGVHEIVCGYTETGRGYLLHGAAAKITVGIGIEASLVFSAFAGIGFAADAVHGDSQRLMSFFADGAEGHGAGGKSLHDFFRGLNFVERNRRVTLLQLH